MQRDGVAANGALAHAELLRGAACVDDEPALQQLEEGEEPGRRTRDTGIQAQLRTKTDRNVVYRFGSLFETERSAP